VIGVFEIEWVESLDSNDMATDVKTSIPPISNPRDPKVMPLIVTVNDEFPIVAPDVVMTKDEVEAVAPQFKTNPSTLVEPGKTKGTISDAKNPGGYVIVIVPPTGTGDAGVKPSVTGTHDKRAILSCAATEKDTDAADKEMDPDATGLDATVSEDVFTMIPKAPGVADPMVKPLIVTKNAVFSIVAPDVVNTMEVVEVALHVAVSSATLVAPGATVGVTPGTKKPEGYVSVMVPPPGMERNGVKPKVIVARETPAIRFNDGMMNSTELTWFLYIGPL
jgi:hypothetical protein